MPHSRRPAAKRTAAADTFRGQIIALLADGKPRDAQAILDEGRKQGLFTAATTKQSVYENLLLYIQQEAAKGRKPAVVEDPISRKFRANHPVDDWPAVTLPPHPRYIKPRALEAISTRLLHHRHRRGLDGVREGRLRRVRALRLRRAARRRHCTRPTASSTRRSARSRIARSSSARARRT